MTLLLVFALLAPQPGFSQEKGGKRATIRLGIIPINAYAPAYLAADRGFFAEEGLEVKLEAMGGGATILPAISGGSLEIGTSNVISFFQAKEQDFDFIIVADNVYESIKPDKSSPLGYRGATALMVAPNSSVRSAKDLEGKKVAVNTLRNINWLGVQEWVSKKGGDPAKITYQEMPFPRMGPSLMAGQLDAANASEPFVTILQSQGARVLDYTYSALRPSFILSAYVASEAWVKKNPDLAEKFARAHNKAIDLLEKDKEEKIKAAVKYFKMNPDLAAKIVWPDWNTKVDVDSLQFLSDLCLKWGIIKSRQDVRKFVYKTAM